MNLSMQRHSLYPIIQKIVNIIANRPRLPILKNILLEIKQKSLFITVTNLEIEIIVQFLLDTEYPSSQSITIPGRKFFEICRNLPNSSNITMTSTNNNKIIINSDNSNFHLHSLPASDFPKTNLWNNDFNITISRLTLKKIIQLTQFSMGNQDTRYYLNGMLFNTENHTIRIVATDGYRLAMCEIIVDYLLPSQSVIIPRKGILEILNLLNIEQEQTNIRIHDNFIQIKIGNYMLSSKLIDAIFPNYQTVFTNTPKIIFQIERIVLKQALKRASILSNEKFRIVNLHFTSNQLKITAHNFEQETSEEILQILYPYNDIEISFNIDYLLDIINTIDTKTLKFSLTNETSSVQIEGIPKIFGSTYILMPIKI